jgi:hypothetical protein
MGARKIPGAFAVWTRTTPYADTPIRRSVSPRVPVLFCQRYSHRRPYSKSDEIRLFFLLRKVVGPLCY